MHLEHSGTALRRAATCEEISSGSFAQRHQFGGHRDTAHDLYMQDGLEGLQLARFGHGQPQQQFFE